MSSILAGISAARTGKVDLVEQDRVVPEALLRGRRERIEDEVRVLAPEGAKKGEPDDVIPVRVGDEEWTGAAATFAGERLAELAQARARVERERVNRRRVEPPRTTYCRRSAPSTTPASRSTP